MEVSDWTPSDLAVSMTSRSPRRCTRSLEHAAVDPNAMHTGRPPRAAPFSGADGVRAWGPRPRTLPAFASSPMSRPCLCIGVATGRGWSARRCFGTVIRPREPSHSHHPSTASSRGAPRSISLRSWRTSIAALEQQPVRADLEAPSSNYATAGPDAVRGEEAVASPAFRRTPVRPCRDLSCPAAPPDSHPSRPLRGPGLSATC